MMRRFSLAFLLLVLVCAGLRAEDLTTRDGTVYKGYKVLSHDAGFLTIMYADGGAKIPLAQLPADLQKQYGYDPAAAAAAAKAAAEQEQKDRQALQAEAAARQQQQAQAAAGQAGAPGSSTGELVTTTGAVGPAAMPTGAVLPPPVDAMSWQAFEEMSEKMGELEGEIARLKLETSGNGGMRGDQEKLTEDQDLLSTLKIKFHQQERFIQLHRMAGPMMSPFVMADRKTELEKLRKELAAMSASTDVLSMADRAGKEERVNLLQLELQFANAPAPMANTVGNGPHTWDEAKSMCDRRIGLFDQIAQLSDNVEAHQMQINSLKEADERLATQQRQFEDQLWAHQVPGFKMSDEDLKVLKAQIATLDAEQAKASKDDPSNKASAHTAFADKQTLWLLLLKQQYANK